MEPITHARGYSAEYATWSQLFIDDLVALDRTANKRSRITCIAVRDLLRRIGEFPVPHPTAVEWEELYACAFAIVARVPRSHIGADASLAARFARIVQFLKDNAQLARLRSA